MIKNKDKEDEFSEDEEPKRFNEAKISLLNPAFSKTGTITAANASKINDGACAIGNHASKLSFDVWSQGQGLRC